MQFSPPPHTCTRNQRTLFVARRICDYVCVSKLFFDARLQQRGQDIAKEVVGEVGTLVKGVHRAGLIRGVLGYWKRDEGHEEDG